MTPTQMMNEIKRLSNDNKPFDITFCTYDEVRDEGGDRKTYKKVYLCSSKNDSNTSTTGVTSSNVLSTSRNPYHNLNMTFNIIKVPGDFSTIRKIHIPLVEKFNNQEIIV